MLFFQWFVAPEGRKVGALKRRVRSHLARWEMKKCTPLWREAHFQAKMYKAHQVRTTFGSWEVEKVHAVVARSTFRSQNVQNTPFSDHFLKLRCRKSARRCGAKHISKSKCTKHTRFGPLLEVAMLKSARRCGAKQISKSKCTKHTMFGPLLDVQMSFRVAGTRDCAPSQKWAKTWGFCSIFNYNHHYTTLHSSNYTTFHYTTLHYTTLRYTTLPLHYTTFHYTTLHYTQLHYTTFHYTTLHYIPLHHTNYNYKNNYKRLR